jgi:hypothetical protein
MSFDNTISESKIPNYSTGESASVSLANIPTENQSSYNSFSCPDITEEEKLILKNIKDKTHILLDLNSHNTRDAELARALQDLATANAALVAERAALVLERAALVAMTGERDVARQDLLAMTGERDVARQDLATANAQHAQALAAETQLKDQARQALATANTQHVIDLAAEQAKTQNAEQALAAETKLKEQAIQDLANEKLITQQLPQLQQALTNANTALLAEQAKTQQLTTNNQQLQQANQTLPQLQKDLADANTALAAEQTKTQQLTVTNQQLTAANTQLTTDNQTLQQALQNANQQANQQQLQQLQDELIKIHGKYKIVQNKSITLSEQVEILAQFLVISRHIRDEEFEDILHEINNNNLFYSIIISEEYITKTPTPAQKAKQDTCKKNFELYLKSNASFIKNSTFRFARQNNNYVSAQNQKPNPINLANVNFDSDSDDESDPLLLSPGALSKLASIPNPNLTLSNTNISPSSPIILTDKALSKMFSSNSKAPASPTTGGYESIYDEIIIWCIVLLILLLIYYLFYVKKDNPLRNCILNQTKTNNKKIIYLNEDITC